MSQIAHRLIRMTGRDPHEEHRAATSLELLFDLIFVVAFGVAGEQAAHLVAEGEIAMGIFGFAFAMFGVIWAWINFTWFASAFDTDDWFYRIVTMLQMLGAVVFALGLPQLFSSLHHGHPNNTVIVLGYVVMRVAMLIQWSRVYLQAPECRPTAIRYIFSLVLAQAGWVVLALAHTSLAVFIGAGAVLILIETSGPFLAERHGSTPWHAHHIAERYGLLVIITLGEGVIGTVAAMTGVVEASHGWTLEAVLVCVAGIGLTFGLWWIYFGVPHGEALHLAQQQSFWWGYGHLPFVASVAAVGAGLHVAAYVIEGEAHVSNLVAVAAVVVPVGLVIAILYLLWSALLGAADSFHLLLLVATLLVLVASLLMAAAGVSMGWCLLVTMLAPVVSVVGYEFVGHRHQAELLERNRSQ